MRSKRPQSALWSKSRSPPAHRALEIEQAKEFVGIGHGVGDGIFGTNYCDGISNVCPVRRRECVLRLEYETNCAGGPRNYGHAPSARRAEQWRVLRADHANGVQIKVAATRLGDAEVRSGVLAIAEIRVGDMKDFLLPGAASRESYAAAT